MSEERKVQRVNAAQLKVLIEEIEKNPSLLTNRGGAQTEEKSFCQKKWEILAKKLNSVENGALKNIHKWQQYLQDWKSNTKRKVAKLNTNEAKAEGNQELTDLEQRLLAAYDGAPYLETEEIDISNIAVKDPLSSGSDDDMLYPDIFTTSSSQVYEEKMSGDQEKSSHGEEVKLKRIQVLSEESLKKQDEMLFRLMSHEASQRDAAAELTCRLAAEASEVEQETAATVRLTEAVQAQTQIMARVLELNQPE